MELQDGVYAAHMKAASVAVAKKTGNLMLVAKFVIDGGLELTYYTVLFAEDGTANTRNISDLKKWSGWDGLDPFWFMTADLSAVPVELVVENEPSILDKTKMWPSVKWVNPPGGGGGAALPEAADRALVMAKYGAKLRAIAGGTAAVARPVRAAAPAVAAVPTAGAAPVRRAAAPAARPPVQAALPQSTQATAWALLNDVGGTVPKTELEELWFRFIDATGMDQADMTEAGWAQVEASIAAWGKRDLGAPAGDERMPF